MLRFFAKAYSLSATSMLADLAVYYIFFKSLPLEDVSIYSNVSTYIILALILFDGQAAQILIKEGVERGGITRNTIKLFLREKRAYFLAGTLVVAVSAGMLPFEQRIYLGLLLLYSLVSLADSVSTALLRVYGLHGTSNALNLANNLTKLATLSMMALIGRVDIDTFIASLFIAKSAYVVLVAIYLRRLKLACTSSAAAQITALSDSSKKSIGHLALASFGNFLENRLDWLLIGTLGNPLALANYALSNKIFELAKTLTGVGLTNIFPLACKSLSRAIPYYAILLVLSLLAYFLIAFASPAMTGVLGGVKYAEAAELTLAFMAASPLCLVTGILYQVSLVHGRTRTIVFGQYVGLALQAVVNVLFLPSLGIKVAVFAMALLWTVMIVSMTFRLRDVTRSRAWMHLVAAGSVAYLLLFALHLAGSL